ncbi:MAG: head maturation protease, ClpP-related [Christensenellales bacterium]|jgi:ATP-dependent Clp protease protease subunit
MRYWNMVSAGRTAEIYIYGYLTSWPIFEDEISASPIVHEIDALDVDNIRVYINSFGGEISESMAICNALIRNKAKVDTYVDGFACSAASDIFMVGDERIMNEQSVLMIHNAWGGATGNAKELRKAADDLEKMSAVTTEWYQQKLKISMEELIELLDAETFMTPTEALEMGFATEILPAVQSTQASASVQALVFQRLTALSHEQGMAAALNRLDSKLDKLLLSAIPKQGTPDRNKLMSFKERLRAMKEKETQA